MSTVGFILVFSWIKTIILYESVGQCMIVASKTIETDIIYF